MPPAAKWINTKGKNNRYGHTFKLWISWAGYRKFIVDDFQLFCPDIKVRRVEVAGSKAGTVSKSCILCYLFYLFGIYIQLPFVVVRVFGQCPLCINIKFNGIADGSLSALHNRWLAQRVVGSINTTKGSDDLGRLIVLDIISSKVNIWFFVFAFPYK